MSEAMPLPSTIELTPSSPSLEDLSKYRDAWIRQATETGRIAQLSFISHNLAINVPRDHRPPQNLRFCQLSQSTTLLFKKHTHLPRGNTRTPIHSYHLRVFLGPAFVQDMTEYQLTYEEIPGKMVTDLVMTNNGKTVDEKLAQKYTKLPIYLPGTWEENIPEAYAKAQSAARKHKREADIHERNILAQKLMIGEYI